MTCLASLDRCKVPKAAESYEVSIKTWSFVSNKIVRPQTINKKKIIFPHIINFLQPCCLIALTQLINSSLSIPVIYCFPHETHAAFWFHKSIKGFSKTINWTLRLTRKVWWSHGGAKSYPACPFIIEGKFVKLHTRRWEIHGKLNCESKNVM